MNVPCRTLQPVSREASPRRINTNHKKIDPIKHKLTKDTKFFSSFAFAPFVALCEYISFTQNIVLTPEFQL